MYISIINLGITYIIHFHMVYTLAIQNKCDRVTTSVRILEGETKDFLIEMGLYQGLALRWYFLIYSWMCLTGTYDYTQMHVFLQMI